MVNTYGSTGFHLADTPYFVFLTLRITHGRDCKKKKGGGRIPNYLLKVKEKNNEVNERKENKVHMH